MLWRLLLRCSILVVVLSCWAHADEGPRLPKVKDFHLRTLLATGDAAQAVIACSDRAAYRPLAEAIRETVKTKTGVMLPIMSDADVTDEVLRRNHVIALGNLMTNRVCARLYCLELFDVDAVWPGKDGALLQIVHNPFGLGRNVVCVSGSDDTGVKTAAGDLLVVLAGSDKAELGQLYRLRTKQRRPRALDDARVERMLKGFKGMTYRTLGSQAMAYGSRLRKFNMAGDARVFRGVIGLMWTEVDALKAVDDMRTTKRLPMIWDAIEESEHFSDADREYISNFFYVTLNRLKWHHPKPPGPFGNNWNAESAFCTANYFAKYYPDLEIGPRILKEVEDVYFLRNIRHWKVAEDCPGYGNITLEGNLHYALTRPNMAYFESGNVKQCADYAVIITNNYGIGSGFGDTGGVGNYAKSVLPLAAWYYRDGGLMWWYKHIKGPGNARFMVDDLPEAPPERFLGVAVAPLDQWVYDRKLSSSYPSNVGQRTFPIEQCFDKMSFRSSFDPNGEYVCLSGFCYGFHSHPDANAIIQYADKGARLLYDDGYMVPEAAEHNTVIVYRDGAAAPLPELARLDHRGDFTRCGITRTTVPAYSGLDWARHMFWKKGRYFFVLDELAANEDGDYGFQSIWRSAGNVEIDGHRFRATQQAVNFNLVHLDDASQSIKRCTPKYPRYRRLVQMRAKTLKKGERHALMNLFYSDTRDKAEPIDARRWGAEGAVIRDGEEVSLIGLDKLHRFAGVEIKARAAWFAADRVAGIGVTEFQSPAVAFHADTPVECEVDFKAGKCVVQTTVSQSVLFNKPGLMRHFDPGTHVMDFDPMKPEAVNALRAELAKAWDSAATTAADGDARQASKNGLTVKAVNRDWGARANLAQLDTVRITSDVTPLTPQEAKFSAGEAPDVAVPQGNVIFPAGQTVTMTFEFPEPRTITGAVVTAKQLHRFRGGTGVRTAEVQVSNDGFKKDVRSLGRIIDLKEIPPNAIVPYAMEVEPTSARWVRFVCQPMTEGRKVYLDSIRIHGERVADGTFLVEDVLSDMGVGDLDGDGVDETVVASTDEKLAAFSVDGRMLWQAPLKSKAEQLSVADLDGDGKAEILAACTNTWLYCVDGAGKLKWEMQPPARSYSRAGYRGVKPFRSSLSIVRAADLDGNGKMEIVVGGKNWRAYLFDYQGKLLWDEVCWAHTPTCVALCDVNGDATKDVVMGNDYAYAVVYDGKTGKILTSLGASWHAGPADVAADDINGDGKADVAIVDRGGRVTFAIPWKSDLKTFEVGAPLTRVRIADLDGDGKKETLVGGFNGYVFVFNSDGTVQARRFMGDAVSDMIVASGSVFVGLDNGDVLRLNAKAEITGRYHGGSRIVRLLAVRTGKGGAARICCARADGSVCWLGE